MSKWLITSVLMGIALPACVTSVQSTPPRKTNDQTIDRFVDRFEFGDHMGVGRLIH
jgi:hypothetical protein